MNTPVGILLNSWFSAGLAVAIFTVLLIILIVVMGKDGVTWRIAYYPGLICTAALLVAGYTTSKSSLLSVNTLLA